MMSYHVIVFLAGDDEVGAKKKRIVFIVNNVSRLGARGSAAVSEMDGWSRVLY